VNHIKAQCECDKAGRVFPGVLDHIRRLRSVGPPPHPKRRESVRLNFPLQHPPLPPHDVAERGILPRSGTSVMLCFLSLLLYTQVTLLL